MQIIPVSRNTYFIILLFSCRVMHCKFYFYFICDNEFLLTDIAHFVVLIFNNAVAHVFNKYYKCSFGILFLPNTIHNALLFKFICN